MRYTVVLEWDEEGHGWAVRVPALSGCFTQGDTVEEALDNAREAIECHVEGLQASGEPIPQEEGPAVVIAQVEVGAGKAA